MMSWSFDSILGLTNERHDKLKSFLQNSHSPRASGRGPAELLQLSNRFNGVPP